MSENEQAAGGVVAWIEARLAEIEAAARAATPGPWQTQHGLVVWSTLENGASELVASETDWSNALHMILNDPAAMLTMVSGLRAVVALHTSRDLSRICPEVVCAHDMEDWPCPTLTQIAAALGYPATPVPTHQPPPEQAANESEMRG